MRRDHIAVFLLGLGLSWNGGNVGPVVVPLEADFGLSLSAIGLLSGTVFFIGLAIADLLGSELGRRVPVARGLIVCCLLGCAGNLLFAVAPGFGVLAAGRLIAGFGLGLVFLYGGTYSRAVGGAKLIGLFGAGIVLGVAGALVVGGALESAGISWRIAFVISAVLALTPLPFLPARVEVAAPPAERREGLLGQAVRSAPMWRLQALAIGTFAIPLVLGAWLIHYLALAGGVATGTAGLIAFLLFAVSAVVRDLGGRLLARGRSPGLLAAGGMTIGAAGLVVLAIEPHVGGAVAAVILIGAGLSLPYALVYEEAPKVIPARPIAGLGLILVGTALFPIPVIPVIGAALTSGDGDLAWVALAAFAVLAGVLNARPVVARPVSN